jgi:hypothetical protein
MVVSPLTEAGTRLRQPKQAKGRQRKRSDSIIVPRPITTSKGSPPLSGI